MIYRLLEKACVLLILLNIITYSSAKHHTKRETFARHYFVELNENNPSATELFMQYIHNHHLENDIHIHRIISHQFLNAISIEIKDTEREYAILKALSEEKQNKIVESISSIRAIQRTEFVAPSMEVASAEKLHNLTAEQVNLLSPHRLSQVDKVHEELSLNGEGLFIGVIDSGK
jgi:hypothetical protein